MMCACVFWIQETGRDSQSQRWLDPHESDGCAKNESLTIRAHKLDPAAEKTLATDCQLPKANEDTGNSG